MKRIVLQKEKMKEEKQRESQLNFLTNRWPTVRGRLDSSLVLSHG